MRAVTSLSLSVFCLLLSSCAQNWDATQQAALSTVAVPAPEIRSDAYQKPVGKMPTGPTPMVMVQGGGFGAGAVGGGLGQLVVEGIGAVQQSMYEKANKDAISGVSGTLPGDVAKRVRKAVVKELNTHSFFEGKVRETSPNRLVVSVSSYGYVRTSKSEGKILMQPQMVGSIELFDADGKSHLKQQVAGFAVSKAHPLEDYANDRKLASDAFNEAIGCFAQQISTAIDLKAGKSGN